MQQQEHKRQHAPDDGDARGRAEDKGTEHGRNVVRFTLPGNSE